MFHCPCDDYKLLRLFWCRHRHIPVFLLLPAHSCGVKEWDGTGAGGRWAGMKVKQGRIGGVVGWWKVEGLVIMKGNRR